MFHWSIVKSLGNTLNLVVATLKFSLSARVQCTSMCGNTLNISIILPSEVLCLNKGNEEV